MNKINNPIVSLFDKNFQLSKEELTTGSIESHIEDVKQNLLNSIKKGVSDSTNSNKNLKSVFKAAPGDNAPGDNAQEVEVQPNTGCFGLRYDIGIPPTKEILKTYDFEFSSTKSFDLSGSIPEIKVNDLPEGVKLLDYVPVYNPECEVLSSDKVLFAGLPCGVPELIMCKKLLSKKVCGKRIYLGEVRYPCGYKQKTIHSVVLEPDDTEPSTIFTIPKTGFNMKGSIYIKVHLKAELYTNAPISILTDAIKSFDKSTYNKTTSNGTNPFKNTDDAIRRVLAIQDFSWILKLLHYAYSIALVGLIFNFTITSIKLSYRVDFTSISAYYGSHKFQATKLSYEQNDFETLKNEAFIALKLESQGVLSLILNLGTYPLGDFNSTIADKAVDLGALLKKCIQNELIKLDPTKTVRFNELNSIMSFLQGGNPISSYILKNINIDVGYSIELCSSFQIPLPQTIGCSKYYFNFEDILEFIKVDLINGIINVLSISTYADLIHLENSTFLPQDVKNKLREINKKIDYANDLYIKYIESAADATVKVLDKIPTEDFPLSPSIEVRVPITPA
jgi:hypothetical protein